MTKIDKQRAVAALGFTAVALHILYDILVGNPIDCLPDFSTLPVEALVQPTPTWWEGTPPLFGSD